MPVIDLHCDTVLKLMDDRENLGLKKNDFSVDIEKLKKADSMAQFFALFVYLKSDRDPLEYCLDMLDKFYCEIEKNSNDIALARNYNEMMENRKNGKISAFLTVEEGGVIKGQMHNLRNLYRLGVRLVTLTWNFPNEIGYPNAEDQYMNMGLTPFGKDVVSEMNRLGMLIDVSHLSDGGFYDVAKLSSKPFVASHSNARSITSHRRNLTDDMIKILADKGGVTGINFAKDFLGEAPLSTVCDMVKHIEHIRRVGGIDVIALGTDFDGISPQLEIKNMGEIEKLICGLKKNKFSDDDIEKIFYKNALRVIKEVL